MMVWKFTQILLELLANGGFALSILMLLTHAQAHHSGFISIDCGQRQNPSYIEETTKLMYESDADFIDTGETKSIHKKYIHDLHQQPYVSLRSFPEGTRNCYKIKVTNSTMYLIRASFLYGNYDSEDKLPEFQLYLGPDLWDTVKLDGVSTITSKELLHIPLRNYLHVCLVNTSNGVPFISTIELRPLPNGTYKTETGSMALVWRYDTGLTANQNGYRPLNNESYNMTMGSLLSLVWRYDTGLIADQNIYRHPVDEYDRLWYYYADGLDWTPINTSSTIAPNECQIPSIVMNTTVTPKDPSDPLTILFEPPGYADQNAEYHDYWHFAEVEDLSKRANQSRQFNIMQDGKVIHTLSPSYLKSETIYSTKAWSFSGENVNFSMVRTENSTLPPILNAYEFYMVKKFLAAETDEHDVEAMEDIKSTYRIRRNWQGDPCAPQVYQWEGVKCSDEVSPRIISLNLSACGLTGEIIPYISNLTMIQSLDLSNNNLTGTLPEFLSKFQNLTVINLDNNKLTGSIPVGLIDRMNSGLLSLSLCGNPNLSGHGSCELEKSEKKHKFFVPVVTSIAGTSVLLLVIAAIWWWGFKQRRQNAGDVKDAKSAPQYESSTKRQFTYSDILKMTNNLQSVLGKGGFGTVYQGYMDNTQVAVKMLSPSSVQGFQQFQAEVNLLMRVHHKNLTSLVGYCKDETHLGLVYEYMANGNLSAHLSDGRANVLSWEDRLRIATDAAQGLEYLHHGCKPPIMHRDVKTTNILLNENFQAKLSDFGLSRNFSTHDGTQASSLLAGTPGYLDPEFYLSNRLNEKSDVYGFGVVLLEIITSRPVISRTHERIHISQWVSLMLASGDINSIVDPKLKSNFNTNSVWKAVEIAMACLSNNANKRPSMSQVVVDLKECLATEQQSHGAQTNYSIELTPNNSIALVTPSVR